LSRRLITHELTHELARRAHTVVSDPLSQKLEFAQLTHELATFSPWAKQGLELGGNQLCCLLQ
jgi:hypothetical protein